MNFTLSGRKVESRMNGVLQNFAQAATNDCIFAGLEHPYTYDDGVCAAGEASAGRGSTGTRIQFDARLAFAHLLHDFKASGADTSGIVSDKQMGNVVGDGRDKNCSLDGGNFFDVLGDTIGTFAKLGLHGGIILAQEPIHGSDHADNVFLGDF